MGGVDDDERPCKRLKATVDLDNLLSISSISSHICSLGGSMARPLPFEGKEDLVGSKGVIKRVEFVRIITEALYSLGYNRSGAELEKESEIQLHSPEVNRLREHVLDGNWDEGVAELRKVDLGNDSILRSASFLIFEQKFFELLDKDDITAALRTLRSEITPLNLNHKRVHELCSLIVSPSLRPLPGFANIGVDPNSRLKVLEELQKVLPPTVMIPERRLEHLVEQALIVQTQDCYFHNSRDTSMSLYTDHQCGKDQIPSQTVQELRAHNDEVWFLNFSNSGKYLASSSKDKTAIIWEVQEDALFLKHRLTGHEKPVLMASWSPDDRQLLTCGMGEVVRRWDVASGECLHVYGKIGFGLISCAWFPDGKHLFAEITDVSICMWDLDGKELECWKGQQRVLKNADMAVTKDGKRIISMSQESVIFLLDRETKLEKLIEEDGAVTSFSLSNDDKFLLVNLVNQEIHLWNILGQPRLVTKYKGHKRDRYLIRSCFGGVNQAFIASGSEDSQVYIWHRDSGKLIQTLAGHSGAVNCVSWNPINPHILASASDDHTIRIWGVNRVNVNMKRKDTHSNGVAYHCNGNSK